MKVSVARDTDRKLRRPYAPSDAQLIVLRAAADLADGWLTLFPDLGEYMSEGDQIALEVSLVPVQRVSLVAIDCEGSRYTLMSRDYESSTVH